MATTRTVSIVLSAKDFASGVLNKVGASLGALSKSAGTGGMGAALSQSFGVVQKSSDGLIDSMTASVLKANAIGQAFNMVGGAIGQARGELEKMSSIQMQSLSSANSLAQVGKISISESSGIIDGMTKDLALKASAWSGSTEGYLQILRQVAPDIAQGSKINGKLMKEDFQRSSTEIVGNFGAIGSASGSRPEETSMFLKRLLNGASTSELNNLSFGMNNPIVTKTLTREMTRLGAASMAQLSKSQQLAVIAAAGRAGNSPEMQKKASESIEGLIQSFHDKIFSPYSGYFGGVNRKLDALPGQSATVTDAYNRALKKLIGEDGLFATITKTLDKMGIKFDPMVSLRNSLDNFSVFIDSLNSSFQGINSQLAAGASVGDLIGGAIADFSSKVSASFSGIGERAATAVNGFVDGLLKNASGVDYGSILQSIGKGLGSLFSEIGSFLSNLDPQVYLLGAGVLIASAIGLVVVSAVGGLVAAIGAAILGLGAPVVLTIAGVGLALVGLFGMFGGQIQAFGSQAWQSIQQFGQSTLSAIANRNNLPLKRRLASPPLKMH